jgi:hypothetical protein
MRPSRHRFRWVLAGTLILGGSSAVLAQGVPGQVYPARAAELEARMLAERIESSISATRDRLRDVAQLPAPREGQLALLGPGIRWNVVSSPTSVQATGPSVQDDPGHDRLWISAGKGLGAIAIPRGWFGGAIAHLPYEPGTARFLLDASRVPVPGTAVPDGHERDLVQQLATDGRGVLESAQSHLAAARVPSSGWTVVVRHPSSGVWTGLKRLEPDFLAPATVVSALPAEPRKGPSGSWSWLGGLALLAGLAVVAGKNPDGLVRLGGQLGRAARRPLALVRDLHVPESLPRALGPDEIDFLRTEQVRNLREIWTHTEERLTGQRHWVRDEIKRLHEDVTEGRRNLAIELNSLAARLEDERLETIQQLADLKTRVDRLERTHRDLEELARDNREWLAHQVTRDEARDAQLAEVHQAVEQVLIEARTVTRTSRTQAEDSLGEKAQAMEAKSRQTDLRVDHVEERLEAVDDRLQSLVARQQEALDRLLGMEQRVGDRLRRMDEQLALGSR